MHFVVFENKKKEFSDKNQQIEDFFKQKMEETLEIKQTVQEKEIEQLKRIKLLNLKEFQIDDVRKQLSQ